MKKLTIALVLLVTPVAGCNLPPPPAASASHTALDEKGLLAVELLYKGARQALEFSVDSGFVSEAQKPVWRERNRRAYAAVLSAEAAYKAGNAANYLQALAFAKLAIADALIVKGKLKMASNMLTTVLDLLKVLPGPIAALPEVFELVQSTKLLFREDTTMQALDDALAAAIEDNAQGALRLDQKLS